MPSQSGRPSGRVIADEFRQRIRSGVMPVGAQLPSSADIQRERGVSSTVVRDAMNALKAEGLVVGQQGKGVFVAPPDHWHAPAPSDDLAERVAALEAQVQALTEEVRSRSDS